MGAGRLLLACAVLAMMTGCASNSPPQNMDNICQIYKEKRHWYKASLEAERKWGVPVQIPMAFIHQESKFERAALPPRKYVLWVIPWGRVSSAAGFAQAQTGTWSDYKRETGNSGASRKNFDDSMDFIGWYMDKTQKVNGVSKWDARNQYLNYHEGWGGYRNRSHNSKSWLLGVASKVESRSNTYGAQYRSCKAELMKPQGLWERLFGV